MYAGEQRHWAGGHPDVFLLGKGRGKRGIGEATVHQVMASEAIYRIFGNHNSLFGV